MATIRRLPSLFLLLGTAGAGSLPCEHPIFCSGRLLTSVQLSGVFNDSKTFVDMPLNASVAQILAAADAELFNASGAPGLDQIRAFLAGGRLFGKVLGRRISPAVRAAPERHSLIDVPNPFVVPGGRFREYYYWDTFWIVRGLLACGMADTARGMIENLVDLVRRFGMVPNGGRIYYRRRSQPPMLALMVGQYFEKTRNVTFLAAVLPTLVQEHHFWVANRSVEAVPGRVLQRYQVAMSSPRPESFREDWLSAGTAAPAGSAGPHWSELAAGAESGWDFSSRWLRDNTDLGSINTSEVIPVDLNAILYRAETELAAFHTTLGNSTGATFFRRASQARQQAMVQLMWNSSTFVWSDYNLTSSNPINADYASTLIPAWAGLADNWSSDTRQGWLKAVLGTGAAGDGHPSFLGFDSGCPTSFVRGSGQQWDFPNVWPPLVSFGVFGLARIGAVSTATVLAQKFIDSAYTSWSSSPQGLMFEKYSALSEGGSGGGGEYVPQNGFGWTNGVVLELLTTFRLSVPSLPPGPRK